jgi:hypothetical protein
MVLVVVVEETGLLESLRYRLKGILLFRCDSTVVIPSILCFVCGNSRRGVELSTHNPPSFHNGRNQNGTSLSQKVHHPPNLT